MSYELIFNGYRIVKEEGKEELRITKIGSEEDKVKVIIEEKVYKVEYGTNIAIKVPITIKTTIITSCTNKDNPKNFQKE